MKKSIFQFVFILTLCCQYINVNAQFITNGTGAIYGETDNTIPIDAIGIGDFTTPGATPNAALDIVIPYLSNNGLIYQGEAIRSTSTRFFDHTWKMFTFNTPLVEKFRIMNIGNVNLATYQAFERGAGQINVYGEKLSSGIYSYTLIADGKVIDTKKMVCVK